MARTKLPSGAPEGTPKTTQTVSPDPRTQTILTTPPAPHGTYLKTMKYYERCSRGNVWTEEDDFKLLYLNSKGFTNGDIAKVYLDHGDKSNISKRHGDILDKVEKMSSDDQEAFRSVLRIGRVFGLERLAAEIGDNKNGAGVGDDDKEANVEHGEKEANVEHVDKEADVEHDDGVEMGGDDKESLGKAPKETEQGLVTET